MKPIADETRRMPPFGSPKREGRTAKRGETTEEKRSQVDPPHSRTDARVHRRGRSRHQSLLRLWECMDGPASPASVPPPATLHEVRLNGFPEALAEVLRHHGGGRRRSVPETDATGFSDARFVVQSVLLGATLRESPAEAGGGLRPL